MSGPMLYHESLGNADNPSIVILHGLLGSGRNWRGVAKALADEFRVHVLDLRNHGNSPHAEPMDYAAMVPDVEKWLAANNPGPVHLVGHSMGGKLAMAVACRQSDHRVRSLVVVDIAPKAYGPRWRAEFAAMRSLDIGAMASRREVEQALEPAVPDWAFRKFFLTNLERRPEGGFRWTVNLPILEAALPELFAHPLGNAEHFAGPTLFLRGELSDYVADDDLERIRAHFPSGHLETVPGAGHNVHFEQSERFVRAVKDFWKAGSA